MSTTEVEANVSAVLELKDASSYGVVNITYVRSSEKVFYKVLWIR